MNKNGISMVVLVITIIVMIIIFSITVPSIINVSDEAKAVKFLSEISIIETKVMQEQINYDTLDSYTLPGTLLTNGTAITIGTEVYPSGTNIGNWYVLSSTNLADMDITDIEGNFVVNYALGKVISQNGVKVNGVIYYTFDDVAEVIDLEI